MPVLDLEILLMLMAWFAGGATQGDAPDMLQYDEPHYSFSEYYEHKNLARTEVFLANAGDSTAHVKLRFLGAFGRELAIHEIEVHPLEFPYIYAGLDLVDRDGEEISIQVEVDLEDRQDGIDTDLEVYLRQMDEDKELGELFEPFSACRRLSGPSDAASWLDC